MKIHAFSPLYLLVFHLFLFSCTQKNGPKEMYKPLKNKGIQIALTDDERVRLSRLISSGNIKDSVDFVNKIRLIKESTELQHPLKTKAKTRSSSPPKPNAEKSEQEEENLAFFHTISADEIVEYPLHKSQQFPGYRPDQTKSFIHTAHKVATFGLRGNQILLDIPYMVTMSKSAPYPILKIAEISQSAPTLRSVGPYWGRLDTSKPKYVQSHNPNSATLHTGAAELRKIIYLEDGKFKLVSSDKPEGKLPLPTNFYNNYIVDGIFSIFSSIDTAGKCKLHFVASLKFVQSGVLRNQ